MQGVGIKAARFSKAVTEEDTGVAALFLSRRSGSESIRTFGQALSSLRPSYKCRVFL